MCIIAIVDLKNGAKIADDTIKTMYTANPHGAGFMVADGKKVTINKGFFDIGQFIKAYRAAEKTAVCAVLHFRIATHGKTDASRCHPFPLSRKPKLLNATHVITDYGIAHNGVYTMYDSIGKDFSDTQSMIATRYYPLLKSNLDTATAWNIIADLNGTCRLVVMDGKGRLKTLGNWQKDGNGVAYSNDSYKPKQFTYYGYGGYDARSLGYWNTPKYYNFQMHAKVIPTDKVSAFVAAHGLQPAYNDGARTAMLDDGTIVRKYYAQGVYYQIGESTPKEYDTLDLAPEMITVQLKC